MQPVPGNAARTRTPTVSFDSIFRRVLTSLCILENASWPSRSASTIGLARSSGGPPQLQFSLHICDADWEAVATITRIRPVIRGQYSAGGDTAHLSQKSAAPFKLSTLIAEVQARDASRGRESIQPVVQGMTVNAGKGPTSPCGKALERVGHGYYILLGSATPSVVREALTLDEGKSRSVRRIGNLSAVELRGRIDNLRSRFVEYADLYDHSVPFTRTGQYELHRETIDRRREVGSAFAAVGDERFTELLYETLQRWGIGRRGSRLVPLSEFRRTLIEHAPLLGALEGSSIEDPSLDMDLIAGKIDQLVTELHVVDNRARIVAGTKTLHHLLPDLVPPMDRA